jgi:predicted aspartyl protease
MDKTKGRSVSFGRRRNREKHEERIRQTCKAGNFLPAPVSSADSLFEAGKFVDAEKIYTEISNETPRNHQALARLGHIALLANRLDDAQKRLMAAIRFRSEETYPKTLLAEVHYRRDEFQQVALLMHALKREAMAKKLESFRNVLPYKVENAMEVTNLRFVMIDPLPVVQVRVNNSNLVNFLIDTGAAEVIIDTEFAKEIGAMQFGPEIGTFAGGRKTAYQHGRVDSLTLGDFTIRNVPIHILDVRRFSYGFGGKRLDGIIGTVLLYHFLATIDYVGNELVLQRKTKDILKRVEQEAVESESVIVPFWMAGDHYMVAWGTVNKSPPMLFFVDTGLAGGGFMCPMSTLRKASIDLQEDEAGQFHGGGGKVRYVPFIVDELTLGGAHEHNVQGSYLGEKSPLKKRAGFHVGGVISHTFFRQYALTIDFVGMRFFLKRKR